MTSVLLLLLAFANAAQPTPAPALVSVARIWDGGAHNAFTDLIRWRNRWYCTFREGDDHVGGDGRIRVLASIDGETWTSAALVGETGIDLRDPKFSITPDDRLMMVAGGSVYEGKRYMGRQPRVMFSSDGSTWSTPQRTLAEGDWLWRVTWHEGRAYGVTYTPEPDDAAEWTATLVSSADGRTFDRVTTLRGARQAERDDAAVHARWGDGSARAARGRQSLRLAGSQPRAVHDVDVARDLASNRRSEFHPTARRRPVGVRTQLSRRSEDGRRTPDPRRWLRASAHAAVRWRHQLRWDGVARGSALGELLRVARGQDRDLLGARESPLT